MQDFVFFLGRFHVLALHLPIGMAIMTVLLDWLSRSPSRAQFAAAAPFLWAATAISAVLTVVLGYMHFAEGGFTGPSASAHRLTGTLVAVACVVIWALRAKRPAFYRKVNVPTGIALLALITLTGHYGGNLTHGSEYLVEYAPPPLRSLAGFPERRAPVTDIAAADPWHDIVQPMLNDRCASCHNADKRNGELSVVDYASLMRGGETGRVVSATAAASELYRRITLPDSDDAFMPAEGKTPLTAAQVEILRWWIDAGAPIDTTLAEADPPTDIYALVRAEVGLDAARAQGAADGSSEAQTIAPDAAMLGALFEAGFLVRQASQSDPRLVVSVHSPGSSLDTEQLAILRTAAASIVSLNLQSAGLVDADLAGFDAFTELKQLRLSNNALTDAGVAVLTDLDNLEVLNLYGNPGISDASLESLLALESLQSVYLWGTAVNAQAAARLREQRPELEVQIGE